MAKADITAARLRWLLNYDPLTGVFTRAVRTTNRVKVGDIAGSPGCRGYIQIMVDSRLYLAHRLAWLFMTGEWPLQMIDHIDGCKVNNKFSNLRDISHRMNQQNIRKPRSTNTSGHLGVSFHLGAQKWTASIHHAGKKRLIGYFDQAADAAKSYIEAKRMLHAGFIELDLHND